jgi:hypothetical protein
MDELSARAGKFSGSIDDLMELLKFFCLAQMSLSIKVESDEGVGWIRVRSGEISDAEVADISGDSAFYVIMQWKDGKFETAPLRADEMQTIVTPWEYLISEAMRFRGSKVKRSDAGDDKDSTEPLHVRMQKMEMVERIKSAFSGDKEARTYLIRDPNRMVQVAVMSNPRVSESEVASFANSRSVDEEVLRRIGNSREWVKAYHVRMALVKNPKTPVSIALKLVQTLQLQDLRQLAKSKTVSSAVAQAARRMLGNRG